MKARIRTIKPEIGKDEELWDLGQKTGFPVYQAFTLLWCYSDREGRFEWRPRQLKSDLLPYWDGDFSRVLDALESCGFIRKYACNGRQFGVVCKFLKHQFINNKEPASELPEPPEDKEKQDFTRDSDATATRPIHAADVPIPSLPFPSRSLPDPEGGAGGVEPVESADSGRPHLRDTSLAERARMATSESSCDRQTVVSQFGQPHTWPEVKAVLDHFQTVNGTPQNVVRSNEARVKAILMWFEAGRTIEDVSEVLTLAQKDDFWKARNIADVLKDLGRLDDFRSKKTTARRSGGKNGPPRQPNHPGANLKTPEYM